jgi:predicted CXXCH cytochrome family protein
MTAAVAGILLAALLLPVFSAAAKLEEGQKALPFKGNNFLTDDEVDLGRHLGKQVILLDFGSIYCSSCMVTVPNLIKLRKRYSEEDLAIFNIYLDIYNPLRVIKFFKGFSRDINLSLLIDDKLAISQDYGIDTLPTTLIVDRSGTIVRRIVGYTEADEKEIDEIVESLVSEQPLLPGAAWEEEGSISVFVPESFTKTTQDDVIIVGYISGEGAKDVSMKLNNLPEKLTTSKDNVFHFRTPLSLAMNLLEIKGQVGEGKEKSQSLVLFRETAMRADIRSELPSYIFHRNEEDKPCKNCHELQVPLKEKSNLQSSDICNACHKGLSTKNVYTHGPITVGGCLPCHDYQSFPNKYELRSSGPDLCFTCHEKIKETIKARDFIHGPTAAGMCIVCHDPHGSGDKYLLRKKMDRLCVSCHQGMLREYSRTSIHRPFEDGDCTSCHDPHAAGDNKLLVLPREELCSKCHDFEAMAHMHQVGIGPKTEFPPNTPLNEAGETTCYTCHLFHASDQVKLWRGEVGQCGIGCHSVPAEEE